MKDRAKVIRCKCGRWLSCCTTCDPAFAAKVAALAAEAAEAEEHNRRLAFLECARRGLSIRSRPAPLVETKAAHPVR